MSQTSTRVEDPSGAAREASPEGATSPPAWRVQSVDRAVLLLRAVARAAGGRAAGTVALGRACGLNRATAWRILSTLESHGLVTSDRLTNRWTIGAGLVDIVRVSGLDTVLRDAHDRLEELARRTGETASLAVLRHGVLVYDDEVAPASLVSATWSGREVSLHATSTGKVLLAWSSPEAVADLVGPSLERFTDTTVTDHAGLWRELEETRERGWAVCRGEYDSQAWGVSAPVLDHASRVLAVLSLWGPRDRIPEERLAELGPVAAGVARELSEPLNSPVD